MRVLVGTAPRAAIFVRIAPLRIVTVTLPPSNCSMAQVKEKLFTMTQVPIEHQKLVYGSTRLKDHQCITDPDLLAVPPITINLVVRGTARRRRRHRRSNPL